MYLSPFQKEIVQLIADENIKTVKDFLSEFELIQDVGVPNNNFDLEFGREFYKFKDIEIVYSALIDFHKVINLLSKQDLIEVNNLAKLQFTKTTWNDDRDKTLDIIWSHQNDFIVIYNEMKKFKHDFRTPQERKEFWERWVPIIVAIATVFMSSLLNYFIYTKEREVYIKNVNAFKDTFNVKILNDIDSSLINNRTELDSINSQKVKRLSGKKLEEE